MGKPTHGEAGGGPTMEKTQTWNKNQDGGGVTHEWGGGKGTGKTPTGKTHNGKSHTWENPPMEKLKRE